MAFDDPVSRYLAPGVTLHERGRPITLRDLATHVSGLPSMPSNLDLHARPDPIAGYSPRDFDRFLNSFEPSELRGKSGRIRTSVSRCSGGCSPRHAGSAERSGCASVFSNHSACTTPRSPCRAHWARRVAPGLDRYGSRQPSGRCGLCRVRVRCDRRPMTCSSISPQF